MTIFLRGNFLEFIFFLIKSLSIKFYTFNNQQYYTQYIRSEKLIKAKADICQVVYLFRMIRVLGKATMYLETDE